MTKNLTKYYTHSGTREYRLLRSGRCTIGDGKSRGITDVNLSVEEGDFFGFIGPNGAGKSTTIRTLIGLISPTSGEAEIFGRDIRKDKTDILSDVGYLPSETMFYHGMKVRDILRFSADMRKKDCSQEAGKLCDRLEIGRAHV